MVGRAGALERIAHAIHRGIRIPPTPELLAAPLRLIPKKIHSRSLAALLNRIFHHEIRDGQFDFLRDRVALIKVVDARLEYRLTLIGPGFGPAPAHRPPDLIFAAGGYDYLLLATRREDPDTLFFQRRLQISGDVELGVHVKNLLYSLEPTIPSPLRDALDRIIDIRERVFVGCSGGDGGVSRAPRGDGRAGRRTSMFWRRTQDTPKTQELRETRQHDARGEQKAGLTQ